MPFENPDDAALAGLLRSARRIAVVGASPRPARDSHRIAAYLLEAGYEVVPVNPTCDAVLGRPTAPDLAAAGPVDLVDVFRAPEHVAGLLEEVARLGLPAAWLQLGVVDAAAAERAAARGVQVVMDRCILVEHRRLLGG